VPGTTAAANMVGAPDMDEEQQATMEKVFAMFDPKNTGSVQVASFPSILRNLGSTVGKDEVKEKIAQVFTDGQTRANFDEFCTIVLPLLEEEDHETVLEELKMAFKLYDPEGKGFITPAILKEMLLELDDSLSPDELNDIVDEVDKDGSGSIDFDEFMAMMTG